MTDVVYVFDLDETLWDGKKLYPGIESSLKNIYNRGHHIYICSFNDLAHIVLKKLNIDKYFTGGSYGRSDFIYKIPKNIMINQIIDYHKNKKKLNVKKIMFFDDDRDNIDLTNNTTINNVLIESYHVKNGNTSELIKIAQAGFLT